MREGLNKKMIPKEHYFYVEFFITRISALPDGLLVSLPVGFAMLNFSGGSIPSHNLKLVTPKDV